MRSERLPRRRSWPTRLAGAVVLGVFAGSGWAQDSDPAPADPVEQLAADDYNQRERATEALIVDDTLTAERIAAWVTTHGDDLETRYRLIDTMRHHVLRSAQEQLSAEGGPGSMGIQHQARPAGVTPGYDGATILVVNTLPGFPAYGRLRPGDVIVRFDGEAIPPAAGDDAGANFKAMIQGHAAGDDVVLTVLRDGEERAVTLRLASGAALQRMYPSQRNAVALNPEYVARWRQERDRLLGQDVEATTDTP